MCAFWSSLIHRDSVICLMVCGWQTRIRNFAESEISPRNSSQRIDLDRGYLDPPVSKNIIHATDRCWNWKKGVHGWIFVRYNREKERKKERKTISGGQGKKYIIEGRDGTFPLPCTRAFILQPWTLFEKYLPSELSRGTGIFWLAKIPFSPKIGKIEEIGREISKIRLVGKSGEGEASDFFSITPSSRYRATFGEEREPVQSRPIQWPCSICWISARWTRAKIRPMFLQTRPGTGSRKLRLLLLICIYIYIYKLYIPSRVVLKNMAARSVAACFHKYSYGEEPRVNQGPTLF